MKYSRRRSRRLRNPAEKEPANQPFFGKSNDTAVQMKEDSPFFQAKLTVGKPGDKYEQEANAVADAVVNRSQRAGGIQKKESEAIQKVDLSTPLEEEKQDTAEKKMERDKEIQEKPELQAKEEEEEMQMQPEDKEEETAQMMGEEEEEMQMQPEDKDEETAQMMGEEEEEMQMQPEDKDEETAQMMGEEEEEMQMQPEDKEKEEEVQMQAGLEEEELQAKAAGPASRRRPSPGLSKKIGELKGKGRPLPGKARAEMENAFGVDFSGVGIHTGQDAVAMNKELRAQAFANGKDIYFNTGKFNPDTSSGKHLLAHELTHVVQQNGLSAKPQSSAVIAKRGEGEKSQAGTNKEKKGKCPSDDEIDKIEQTYRDIIKSARDRGANVAADNLEYFLSGAGGKKPMSASWLRGFDEVLAAERRNQERFEESLNELADKMKPGQKKTHNDYWDAMFTAGMTTELYYASGTSTITSNGSFTLARDGDVVKITGKVDHRWHDPYDWHAGLGAFIPGHGNVPDEYGLVMQSCRGAKPFEMEAKWSQSLSGTITIKDYWFNSSSFKWTGP